MRCLALTLIGMTMLAAAGFAQPPTDPNVEFTQLFTNWKTILGKLRELQARHSSANDGEKPALRKQYEDLLAEGNDILAKISGKAEAAYSAKPDNSGEPAEFLATAAMRAYAREDYDMAYRFFKLLTDHGFDKEGYFEPIGFVAFCANDFPMADKYLKLAGEKKSIKNQTAQAFAGSVGEHKKMWEKELAIREAEAKQDDLPRVKLETSAGDIVIELFENEAPIAVANFISLIEKKFYDGIVFHRVLPQFMAQGGDPTGTGRGGPGYQIPCECGQANHRNHFRGTLSMAHAGKDTGGSQFFLTFVPTPMLNGKHTAFGRVIEGMDVLGKIQRIDPEKPDPTIKPDKIIMATVIRKRPHTYEPKKMGSGN